MENVHTFDRKIEMKYSIPLVDSNVKNKLFREISTVLSQDSKYMIEEIIKGGNIDQTNGYDASDMFYYLLLNGVGEDFHKNLDEQLTDMFRLGKCPQGRVIRLISLMNAFVK